MISQWNDKLPSVRYVDYQGNDITHINDVPSVSGCIDKGSNYYQGSRQCKSVAYEKESKTRYVKHTKIGLNVNYKLGVDSYNMDCKGLKSNNRIDES